MCVCVCASILTGSQKRKTKNSYSIPSTKINTNKDIDKTNEKPYYIPDPNVSIVLTKYLSYCCDVFFFYGHDSLNPLAVKISVHYFNQFLCNRNIQFQHSEKLIIATTIK